MYWCGMMIRCGEHELQTTLPHFLSFVSILPKLKLEIGSSFLTCNGVSARIC